MSVEEKYESCIIDEHEIRRYELSDGKYLFKREKHKGGKDFFIVYVGDDREAWKNIKWRQNVS